MTMFLALHVLAGGLWLGCVLTEVAFERTLLGQGDRAQKLLAHLHARVDMYVEAPAIVLLLVTGAVRVPMTRLDGWLFTMMAAGTAAVLANLWCMRLVWQRRQAADDNDWERFARLDRAQHQWGAVVLAGIALAAASGLLRWVR